MASDGTETEVYPKTLIQNGTDGTIITENYAEGNTTVQVSHNFTDKTTYPKGTYKVELYLTDTATKPVAEGTFVIAERPLKLVFFHDDHLGTPRLITDEDGQTVSIHDYLAYGEEITTADFQTNRMKFTGHERDPETGLDYMLARYYTSGSGRFLQVDPGYDYKMEEPMAWNLYSYTGGNPIRYTDPTGMVIHDSAAENDKKNGKAYKKWKKKLLSTKKGRALWNKLDSAKAVFTISFSTENMTQADVGKLENAEFDENTGELQSADIHFNPAAIGRFGSVGDMQDTDGYDFGSTLTKQTERKIYSFAHELGHAEELLSPEGAANYRKWQGLGEQLLAYAHSFKNGSSYSKAFVQRPDMQQLQNRINKLHLDREHYADSIGKGVIMDWRKK